MVGGVIVARAVQRNTWRQVQQAATTSPTPTPSTFSEVTQTQYATQRFLASASGTANPQFLLTRSRNRLVDNGSAIYRGYIRRSDIDPADPTSNYRLYFMYNPSTIQRNYIAYLNQSALDPGNALFGSNNMAAAPGILDFSFNLIFDRHLEVAQDASHPGTKVDYDYFDLVVRGVVPDGTGEGNAIPDNGIMMVNPNNITVVFGEDLSVHGRPYNASVSFEKFNHRMVPTRMTINIVMKAFYIGPVRTNNNFSTTQEELNASATIPYSKNGVILRTVASPEFDSLTWVDTTVSSYQNVSTLASTSTTLPPPPGDSTGRVLTIPQAAQYAKVEGFSGESLITAIAVAMGESGLRTDAVGDTSLVDATWGPSIGLMQIRSLNADKGTGRPRDELANYDPGHNLWAAWLISSSGTNFNPWSVYTSGKYRQYVDQVRRELGTVLV